MTPIRFGACDQQLFAMLHTPAKEPRGEAVLLCNPFGQEAIRTHRLFRVMADQLARQGFHVLRFDYFGTGDSAGEDGEGELERWIQDVLLADMELRQRSQCRRVSWFGLRFGASIAALASSRAAHPVHRLLLWDPVLDGRSYLKELADAHLESCRISFGARWFIEPCLRTRAANETQSEALGFSLAPRLREQVCEVTPHRLASAEARQRFVMATPQLDGLDVLRQECKNMNKSLAITMTAEKINWTTNEAMDSSIVPLEALNSVMSLMKDRQ